MVVTTQHIDEAARCDRVIVLRRGEVVADAVPEALARDAGLGEELMIVVPVDQRERAAEAVASIGPAQKLAGGIVVSTPDASTAAADAARLLADARVDVLELDTQVPALDEVFRAIVEDD